MKISHSVMALGILAGSPCLALAQPEAAQPPSSQAPAALADLYACAEIDDDARRLACYDAAAGRLKAAETSGALVAVDRVQAATIEREAFGFSLPSMSRLFRGRGGQARSDAAAVPAPAPIPEVDNVEMEIARVVQRGGGRIAFVMTNGQTWVQTEAQPARLARAGGAVTVRRASLGSYLMEVEAGGPSFRVRREE